MNENSKQQQLSIKNFQPKICPPQPAKKQKQNIKKTLPYVPNQVDRQQQRQRQQAQQQQSQQKLMRQTEGEKLRPRANVPQQNDQDEGEQLYFRIVRPIKFGAPDEELVVNTGPRKLKMNANGSVQHGSTQTNEPTSQPNLQTLTTLFSNLSLVKNPVQYFLKRIDCTPVYSTNSQKILHQEFIPKLEQHSQNMHRDNRERLLNRARGMADTRRRVRIVDVEEQGQVVEFGGQVLEVETMPAINKQYYYLLKKRQHIKPNLPSVHLPQDKLHLLTQIQFQQHQSDQQQSPQQQDEDSNRQSNPDYDYPEEDYQDSGDEGVIDRDYYPGRVDSEEGEGDEDGELDQEEIYRRYLRKCGKGKGKMEDSDDQYF